MNKAQVFELLEKNKKPRGIENWQKLTETGGLSSFGIGLTVQRKLAKQIGKKRLLAHELWATDNYDAKVLGLLIDDPKQITTEQAEQQVEELNSAALEVAERIGPIDFNEDGQKCDPFDVVKHLTSDYLKKKLGIA